MRKLLLTLGVSLLGTTAYAQTARSGGGGNAQILQEMQQLAAERTQLQADNAHLKEELESLRKERDALKSAQQGAGARQRASEAAVAHADEERSTAQDELMREKGRMQELIAKFRETVDNLRKVETEKTTAVQSLATRDTELKSCVEKNQAMYKLNGEVLDRMEHQGVWSQLAQKEPFTRIKRTQLENLADEYREKAQDQRVAGGEK